MERTDILELMSTLKLYGMRAAYDEVMATAIKRRGLTQNVRCSLHLPTGAANRY
jgi:hypothetical protein